MRSCCRLVEIEAHVDHVIGKQVSEKIENGVDGADLAVDWYFDDLILIGWRTVDQALNKMEVTTDLAT